MGIGITQMSNMSLTYKKSEKQRQFHLDVPYVLKSTQGGIFVV